MKKRNLLFILFTFSTTLLFAQNINTYKGVVVDKNKSPLDVFSVVLFNAKDSTKQLYTNTFTNGNFEIPFTPIKGERYGAYLLSMGYKDTNLPLSKLTDTIVMTNNSIVLDDAVVEGKRKVTTSLGDEGGLVFDVSNTYLSNLGNSTDLLNFIPGVKADKNGSVTMVGVQGEVVVYVNNIRIKEVEKLKMYKSEDINSVEVLRSPGAKYKNAAAVILIKTNKEYEGFSSMIDLQAFLKDNTKYSFVPSIQGSYTKGKITASLSYNLDRDVLEEESRADKVIDKYISPNNWVFEDKGAKDNDIYNHWYNANLDYRINEKNLLTFQYSGRYNKSNSESSTLQTISANSFGNLLNNKYTLNSDVANKSNTGHIYYKGNYSKNFTLEYNADYASRNNDNTNLNSWQEGDSESKPFNQTTKSKASAFTTDILLINTIKKKHSLSYGLEYSYLQDEVNSNTKEDVATSYKQNSSFLKTILEYKVQVIEPLSLSLGFNYLYNNVNDNNTTGKGKNYHSIVPYIGLQYYNAKKQLGLGLNVKHNNYQPNAGMLDDITVNYISPYEVSTGNKNLKNMKVTSVDFSLSYKQFFMGLMYQNATNLILDISTIEMQGDKPLINTKPINLGTPINAGGGYIGYNNKFKFWTPSVSIFAMYSNTKMPNTEGVNESYNGFFGGFSMQNLFDLPKNFYITLSGYYQPKGYILYEHQGESYSVKFNVEKRLLKDQLRITLMSKIDNRWDGSSFDINGLYKSTNTKTSWNKFVGIGISWRFNNHKEVQKAKESTYINML
ncbi:MAG: outer membrane beta-barrel protein [Rikenellaceae bacterium]